MAAPPPYDAATGKAPAGNTTYPPPQGQYPLPQDQYPPVQSQYPPPGQQPYGQPMYGQPPAGQPVMTQPTTVVVTQPTIVGAGVCPHCHQGHIVQDLNVGMVVLMIVCCFFIGIFSLLFLLCMYRRVCNVCGREA